MTKFKGILCVLLMISFYSAVANQPEDNPKTDAMLFGDVQSNGEHIPFATVTVKGTTIGTAADATGHFKLANLPVGEQTIVVSAIGYRNTEKVIEFEAKKSITVFFEMEPDVIGLDQVVVSADRNAKNRRESATIVNSINPQLMGRTQNVTLAEGLNFAPGLRMENNCQNCGFSQVRMNGLEGPYSQILINSRPVFSGLAGVYGLELIPANMIDRVEVIRGGGSAMYGSNAIAGTINLITRDPLNDHYSASGSYGLTGVGTDGDAANDYNMNLNGSFVSDDFKTGMTIFGFSRRRDPFDANGDGFSEIALIENTTLGTSLYQRLSNRGKITLDYFNINEFRRGGNKFDLPLHESDVSESVRHKINSAALTFDLLMREVDKFSVFFSAQKVDRESYYGANQDLSAYGNTKDFTFSSGMQYSRNIEHFIVAPGVVTAGLEYNGSFLEDTKLGYYDPEEDEHFGNTLVAEQQVITKAGFLQTEWKTEAVVFTMGLRYDSYQVSDRTNESSAISGDVFSPRISLLYNITDHLQFRAGFARGFRTPQIFDEDLHIETSGSRQVLHRNADNLKQEASNSYTTSLDFSEEFGRWQFQLLAEGFYTNLIDPFANEYGTPDENGVVVYTRVNAKKGAVVKGVNFELNLSPSTRLQLQSGFTVQQSVYEEPQEFDNKRFFRSPDNYGYISLNYNPLYSLTFSFTGNYTGKMLVPYFGPRATNSESGQLNITDSFFDAGIKVSYDINLTQAVTLQLNGGVKNFFNSYQYDFDTGENRDPAYIYGPLTPRTIYFGIKLGNII